MGDWRRWHDVKVARRERLEMIVARLSRIFIVVFVATLLFFFSSRVSFSQVCPQAMVLRSASCPVGSVTPCTTKGAALNITEGDQAFLNIVNLCNAFGTQPPNTFLAGPASGGVPATPGFRVISDADVPDTITKTGTASRCARFDASGILSAATGDCPSGDTTGGGGGAPTDATYLTVASNATLTAERTISAGVGLASADNGANSSLVLSFFTSDTLAGNPTYSSEDVVFTKDGSGGGLLFEGVTADTIEGILVFNPTTSDRTVTIPDVTGTLISSADTGTVTGTMVLNDTIALTTDTTGNYAAGDAEAGNATGLACTTCVDTSDIGNDTITEPKLKVVDTPADEECLTYETTAGDFEWQTCGSGGSATNPVTTIDEVDEFFSRSSNTTYGTFEWSLSAPSAGVHSEAGHPGAVAVNTNAAANDVATLMLGPNNTWYNVTPADIDRVQFLIKTPADVTSTEIRVGFMQSCTSTDGGSAYLKIDYDRSVSTNWFLRSMTGGTSTNTDSTIAVVAATWYLLEIVKSGANYEIWINGTSRGSHSTNIPASIIQFCMVIEAEAASARQLVVDMFRYKSGTLTRY